MEAQTYESILTRMKDTFRKEADMEADDASDLGIRMKVLAGEIFSLFHSVDWLKRQVFPQTAQGEYLTMHGEQRGLKRKPALSAAGTLTFSRQNPLAYDLAIPLGTVCSTEGETAARFQTSRAAILKAGYRSVTVEAQAVEPGTASNAAVGAVTVMVTPPAGIETVTNESPFTGGADGENDEELRERILQSYAQVSNGTNAEFYRSYALQYEGIRSVGVVPRENGVGTVSLYLAARGGEPSEELIQKIQAELNALREINVDVQVKAAVEKSVRLACYLQPADGYTFEEVKPICQEALNRYYLSLGVGEAVILTHIGKQLLETGVLKNYKFYSVSVDTAVGVTEIAVAGTTVWNPLTGGV